MKRYILIILTILLIAIPVNATETEAPLPPDDAQALMPTDRLSFGESLWYIAKSAIQTLRPDIAEACKVCLSILVSAMLLSLLTEISGVTKSVAELCGTIIISCMVLGSANALISVAADTIKQLSDYGKLMLPVMTTTMAAQGGVTASVALYTGTALFDAVLSSLIAAVLVPLIYIFLVISIANSALGQEQLKKLQEFIQWLVTWCLKSILYVFTGYMTITGVVSGTADQTAIKAAKLTISGFVPVVGGILSDASETILVSAGVVKNAAGVYGLLAVIAIAIGPFLRIGVHYLLLKLTAAISGVFATKQVTTLVQHFSCAMGLLLAMTGTVCLLLLISTVCFLKGVG